MHCYSLESRVSRSYLLAEAQKRGRMDTLGKRKRSITEIEEDEEAKATSTPPLTEANLAAFLLSENASQSISQSSVESMSVSSNASQKSEQKSRGLLDSCSIFIDKNKDMPEDLKNLCDNLRKRRDGPITPVSKKIAESWSRTRNYMEDDAIRALENLLGYRGEFDDIEPGVTVEKNVFRGRNHNFTTKCVPVPEKEDKALQTLLNIAGSPKTPRPDISYGYPDEVFTTGELRTLRALGPTTLVTQMQPWLPYWIVEWKSSMTGGTIQQAETQARRDGAGAVNFMHKLYDGLNMGFSNTDTVIFTACIDSEIVRIRTHWRCDSGPANEAAMTAAAVAGISYESDMLVQGFLSDENAMFQVRSTIFAILEWARTTRLRRIKTALHL